MYGNLDPILTWDRLCNNKLRLQTLVFTCNRNLKSRVLICLRSSAILSKLESTGRRWFRRRRKLKETERIPNSVVGDYNRTNKVSMDCAVQSMASICPIDDRFDNDDAGFKKGNYIKGFSQVEVSHEEVARRGDGDSV